MRTWTKNQKTFFRISLFVVSGFLLLISMTSFWLYRTMFNTDTFSEITTTAITEESSRNAIGSYVSDKVFEDKPLLKSTVGPRLASFVSGLLGSDLAGNTLTRLTERLQLLVTTEQKPPVVIELGGVKDVIVQFQTATGRTEEEKKIDASQIPDEIMVLDTSKIPNFYSYGVVLLWLGPLSLLLSIGGLWAWVHRGRKHALVRRLEIVSLVIFGTAVVALIMGPLIKPSFLAAAETASAQVVLSNLYDGFMAVFNQQAFVVGFFAVLLFVGCLAYTFWRRQQHKKS